MIALLGPIETAISQFIVAIHSVISDLAGPQAGWGWALAIVGLVAAIRIVLFPLFAKQSRSMRQMQLLQPKVKELQRKYKDDKQQQQQELMKLYKETGVNPASGCLPMIVQAPIFYALYRTLYSISNTKGGLFSSPTGFSKGQAHDIGVSTLFGTPISAAFNSSQHFLDQLDAAGAHVGSQTTVKIVTAAFIVAMSIATFITSRQSMARNQAMQTPGQETNPLMKQQKLILYAMPVFLAVFGYRVPLGALIYWLSNNVFTLVQQHFLYRRMDVEAAGGSARPGGAPAPALTPDKAGGPPTGKAVRRPAPQETTAPGKTEDKEPAPAKPWQSGPTSTRKRNRRRRERGGETRKATQ